MKSVRDEIVRAFAGAPHPGPNLLHAECRDGEPVAPFEAYGRWQDVPSEELCLNYDAMSFFSPAAFRFFLPAFMCVALDVYRESDAFVSDATVYELVPDSDFARSRFVGFSTPECRAVAHFLEVMQNDPNHADSVEAEAALAGH